MMQLVRNIFIKSIFAVKQTDIFRTNVQGIFIVFVTKLQIGSTIRRALEPNSYILYSMQY